LRLGHYTYCEAPFRLAQKISFGTADRDAEKRRRSFCRTGGAPLRRLDQQIPSAFIGLHPRPKAVLFGPPLIIQLRNTQKLEMKFKVTILSMHVVQL
jgi:hypothetical protein